MAELTCSVNTCASHNGGYCCRNSIKIDGHSAVMKDQTFCGSFQQKTGGAVNEMCIRDSTQMLLDHRGALNVPARTALAPRGLPIGLTRLGCLPPVSYTHLDVYKRQISCSVHLHFG